MRNKQGIDNINIGQVMKREKTREDWIEEDWIERNKEKTNAAVS